MFIALQLYLELVTWDWHSATCPLLLVGEALRRPRPDNKDSCQEHSDLNSDGGHDDDKEDVDRDNQGRIKYLRRHHGGGVSGGQRLSIAQDSVCKGYSLTVNFFAEEEMLYR